MVRSKQKHLGFGAILVIAVLCLVSAPVSAAEVTHTFSGSFGAATSTPSNPYPIANPNDVDVDQATHDVYVTDPGNYRIEKFDSNGNFILMFGKGVNQTTGGNVCPVSPGDVCQAGSPGASPGSFESPLVIAVDNYPGGNGDVYVGDPQTHLVQKFDSGGRIISSWGVAGQKNGADNTNSPGFGTIVGLAVGAECATPNAPNYGACSPTGALYVRRGGGNERTIMYTRSGTFVKEVTTESAAFEAPSDWLEVDAEGRVFYSGPGPGFEIFGPAIVKESVPIKGQYGSQVFPFGTEPTVAGLALDPSNHELYQNAGTQIFHYPGDCRGSVQRCAPNDTFGSPAELQEGRGLAVDAASHTVYVADKAANQIVVFGDVRPLVTTEAPSDVTTSSVTLNGQVDPAAGGPINDCFFEYGFDEDYGKKIPCVPDATAGNYTGTTAVSATISGLSPGTRQHYRLVATNTEGATGRGADLTFTTTAAPAINGLLAENLTATTAELFAVVNPNGLETRYTFEYGPTILYGKTVSGTLSAGTTDQQITVKLTDLEPKVQYHYRLVADNRVAGKEEGGVTVSEDHTFNFYPPKCPNESVRQQTTSNYLPDCRAYELVSPSDANGTSLFAGGPNTGYATSPSRFSFTGTLGTIREAGGSPINAAGDLYVATRTDIGWKTRYVGFPSAEAALAGGPPQGLWGQGGVEHPKSRAYAQNGPDTLQINVLTDPGMNRFLDWNVGPQEVLPPNPTPIASNAAHVWRWDGSPEGIWPTNLATVPPGVNPSVPSGVSPGGMRALDCPTIQMGNTSSLAEGNCPGEVTASADLSHFVFSSGWNVFAPGGRVSPPGSVYDNNTETGEIVVASKTSAGLDIPREPGNSTEYPLEIPSVSADGSRILIAAPGVGPCGLSSCPSPPCGMTGATPQGGFKEHCPPQPSHLYLRANGSVTYDVSEGRSVSFIGGTADLTKVYFTSPYQQTPGDDDSSVDLYMWSQAGASSGTPLTLVSKASNAGLPGEAGNSDACDAEFVTNCGVTVFDDNDQCQLYGNLGGNCRSDTPIAADAGDIYFFSPEELDGSRGRPNKENLYVFRNGQAEYVTTMTTGTYCYKLPEFVPFCGNSPIARMQVTPDGSHMAFQTDSPVTQNETGGLLEMYRYDPDPHRLICVSCKPDGQAPSSIVWASQDGLFLANDGRTFFSTEDALVHTDTNQGPDVYEYVGGRPQLLTTGTGDTRSPGGLLQVLSSPGLIGVSADGRDVYFSTYETLVRQDRNGLFLKFYDARAGGGFPALPPPPPCEAADECHGVGSSPPPTPQGESGAVLSGGNLAAKPRKKKRHRHKRRHRPRRHKHQARSHKHQGRSHKHQARSDNRGTSR
jgi:hypothetical protein